jgi:hypothetical protein
MINRTYYIIIIIIITIIGGGGGSSSSSSSSSNNSNIGTWRPKGGIVKSEWTFIARQRLGKHIPAATNTQAKIE